MAEVPNFSLPYHFERRMCHNCSLVDTYYTIGVFKCKHCHYNHFGCSTEFEDDWVNHQKNQRALEEAKDLVADLQHEIDKFEKGWSSTWNSYSTEQIDFETPELINPFSYFSGD